jgi:hypothetical protein
MDQNKITDIVHGNEKITLKDVKNFMGKLPNKNERYPFNLVIRYVIALGAINFIAQYVVGTPHYEAAIGQTFFEFGGLMTAWLCWMPPKSE